jgi:hypothetical protein
MISCVSGLGRLWVKHAVVCREIQLLWDRVAWTPLACRLALELTASCPED